MSRGWITRRTGATMLAAVAVLGLTTAPSGAVTTSGPSMTARGLGVAMVGTGVFSALSVPAGGGDTGVVSTDDATAIGPKCALEVPSLVVVTATAACGALVTAPIGAAGATGWVGAAAITLPGVPPISVIGARSAAAAGCGVAPQGEGSVAEVRVAGMPITVAPGPNARSVLVDKGKVTVALIVDERLTVAGGLTVNAARLAVRMPGGNNLDIVLGSSSSAVTNCPTA